MQRICELVWPKMTTDQRSNTLEPHVNKLRDALDAVFPAAETGWEIRCEDGWYGLFLSNEILSSSTRRRRTKSPT